MTSPYIGELRPFPYNFAPRGWAFCDGQILAISQNTALFSILGTTYGGNGQTTFALPDLRSRSPIHTGQGPGLSPYVLGEQAGEDTVTLLTTEIPSHNHTMTTRNDPTTDANYVAAPVAGYFVSRYLYHVNSSALAWTKATTGPTALHANTVSAAGSGTPHANRQPYLTINWCIATQGIFPPRN
jgi:microcystin-dependent protein